MGTTHIERVAARDGRIFTVEYRGDRLELWDRTGAKPRKLATSVDDNDGVDSVFDRLLPTRDFIYWTASWHDTTDPGKAARSSIYCTSAR
jgi:hypothetical protein